jgi:hypothetical protein
MFLMNRSDEFVLREVHDCMAKVCAASRNQAVHLVFVILLNLPHTDVTILRPNEHDSTARSAYYMFVLLLMFLADWYDNALGNVALSAGLPNPDQLLKHGFLVLRLVKYLQRRTAALQLVFTATGLL